MNISAFISSGPFYSGDGPFYHKKRKSKTYGYGKAEEV